MSDPTTVPEPLEWHPAYRDKTWLLDWIEGRGSRHDTIQLPVMRPTSALWSESVSPVSDVPVMPSITMTRRRCWGPAPWTGFPYHYEWWVGVDELQRCVASDARIVEERGETFYRLRCTDPSKLPVYGEQPPEVDPLSDDLVKMSLTDDEALLLSMWVQEHGPIPDGRLHEAVEAIRKYLS